MERTAFVYVVCSARDRYEIEPYLKDAPIIETWLRPGGRIVAIIQCPAKRVDELTVRLSAQGLGGRVFESKEAARRAAIERARR